MSMSSWWRPWRWGRLKAGGEGDDRGWDGWMASLPQWTWVWASSRSWWWTRKPAVLQSMGLQRVRHDWVTELSWCLPLGIRQDWVTVLTNEDEASVPRWMLRLDHTRWFKFCLPCWNTCSSSFQSLGKNSYYKEFWISPDRVHGRALKPHREGVWTVQLPAILKLPHKRPWVRTHATPFPPAPLNSWPTETMRKDKIIVCLWSKLLVADILSVSGRWPFGSSCQCSVVIPKSEAWLLLLPWGGGV